MPAVYRVVSLEITIGDFNEAKLLSVPHLAHTWRRDTGRSLRFCGMYQVPIMRKNPGIGDSRRGSVWP